MSVSELDRHELFTAFKAVLGESQAATMMDLLPPVGWGDVARRSDIEALERRLEVELSAIQTQFASLHGEFGALRSGVGSGFGAVESEFGAVQSEFGAVQSEFGAVRTEFGAVRAEFGAEFRAVRAEMRAMEDRIVGQLTFRLISTMVALSGVIVAAVALT